MTQRGQYWAVKFSAAAEADYLDILSWTAEHFGEAQAVAYAETIDSAVAELKAGPKIVGAIRRDEFAKGMFSVHVARRGRKGRHFLVCRSVNGTTRKIEIVRILHDSMDIARHVGDEPESQ